MRDFTKTKAALAAYDTADAAFAAELATLSNQKAYAAFEELERLVLEVSRCFFEETCDINSSSCVNTVTPSAWLRKTIGVPYDAERLKAR